VACPGSTYFYGGLDPSQPIPVVAASDDTMFSIHGCDRVHGRYQVNAGLLIASVDFACGVDSGTGASGLETVLEDDFVVSGPAAGTPVTFDAVLDLEGSAACFSEPGAGGGGRVRGLVREGASNERSVQHATSIPSVPYVAVNESLTLPVSAVAGSPVHLRFAVRGEALDGAASLQGTFRFANLPAGASVTSCRGYSSAAPVPARATTWGGLKSRYR
jgi:hypothetical protein